MSKKSAKIERRVYSFIDKMARHMGLEVPRDKYPNVRTTERTSSLYDPNTNTLIIGYKDAHSGDAYGEEIGHFLRKYAQPTGDHKEKQTNEFFGYLGRRVLKEVAGKKPDLNFKLDKAIGTKKEAVEAARMHRENAKRLRQYASEEKQSGVISSTYAKLRAKSEDAKRRDVLEHYRGYEFASQVDLDRTNYPELYSLPNSEVRKRFFRKEKQYSLEEASNETNDRGLAGKLAAIIFIISLTLSLFSYSNLTGNVIGNPLKSTSSIFGLILLIIGLIAGFFWLRINKKK